MTGEIKTSDFSLFSPEARINNTLSLLTAEQIRARTTENSLPKSIGSFRELRNWYKNTDQFQQIYQESSIYFCTPRTSEQVTEYKKHLAGSCYQFMAYSYHAARQTEGITLLSPSRTLAFYDSLFPKARKLTSLLGLDSLTVSVPDGLEIQDNGGVPKILRVIEYTLAGDESYLQNKFGVYEDRVQKFPELFDDTKLVFVMPTIKWAGSLPRFIRENKARVIDMPFGHKKFRKFINGIFEHYRPGADYDRPTLNEIQESISMRPTVT